jgi:diacylglycerol kinase (ATP)
MTSENLGKPGNTGLKRIIKAAGYSVQGLKAGWKNEAAIRQELTLLLVSLPVIIWVDVAMLEKILLLGVVVLVLITELLNSAIEAVVDRVGIEHHELSGRAKDMGSAAVMIALIFAGITWLLILGNRYWF